MRSDEEGQHSYQGAESQELSSVQTEHAEQYLIPTCPECEALSVQTCIPERVNAIRLLGWIIPFLVNARKPSYKKQRIRRLHKVSRLPASSVHPPVVM